MAACEDLSVTNSSLNINSSNCNINNSSTTASSSSSANTILSTPIIKSIQKQRGGISESSTTSDNTTDFIEIVKKHDIVYNTHHPDYKNVEVKLKVWSQIAEEIGLTVDASKRKWKNLRDSYTKYLRSFRVGTKTSKKYQFWAHAEHMEFLKPYQGPGRSTTTVIAPKDDEDTECDLGYQVLSKATANATDEEDLKQNSGLNNIAIKNLPITATNIANLLPNYVANGGASGIKTSSIGLTMPTSSLSGTIMLPVPSLPTVQLPPSLTAKPILANIPTSSSSTVTTCSTASSTVCSSNINLNNTSLSYTTPASIALTSTTSMPSQVFTLPQLSTKGPIPMPSSNTASSVGCLIIEPQLFASADTFKKEFNNSSSIYSSSSTAQITPTGLQIYPNVSSHVSNANSQTMASRLNPPLITKIRRVQPSPQSSAINLSFSTTTPSTSTANSALSTYQTNGFSTITNTFIPPSLGGSTTITATTNNIGNGNLGVGGGPPPAKKLKSAEVDISAILQANRDLDANTLFFLSLARSVRAMPTKFQSLAKMRCMRIVSDIEMELDNITNEVNGDANNSNSKYCTNDTDAPPAAMGNNVNETMNSEHFVYVMSPSRLESMIDLSSDDETAGNNV